MSARERCELCGVRKSPIHDRLCAELQAKQKPQVTQDAPVESYPVTSGAPAESYLTVGEVLAAPNKLAEANEKIAELEEANADLKERLRGLEESQCEECEGLQTRLTELEETACPSCEDFLRELGISKHDWQCTENSANRFELLKKMGVLR